MRSYDSLMKVRQWNLDEQQQKLHTLEQLLNDLYFQSEKLDQEFEQEKDYILQNSDTNITYSQFLTSLRDRRKKIEASIEMVETQITHAREDVNLAYQELKRVEFIHNNNVAKQKQIEEKKQNTMLDELAINQFIANQNK